MKTRFSPVFGLLVLFGLTSTASAQSESEGGSPIMNIVGPLIVLVVLGGLVGALFLLKRERHGSPKSRPCPACGSLDTESPKGATVFPGVRLSEGSNPARYLLFGMVGDAIRIPPLRQCSPCGTLWRPACSFSTAVATLVAGFVAFGLAIGCEYAAFYFCLDDVRQGDGPTLGMFIAWLAFGLYFLVISIRVLLRGITLTRGRGCALEILSRGKAEVEGSKA